MGRSVWSNASGQRSTRSSSTCSPTPPRPCPGTITIETRREGPMAVIEVADTGPGISSEALSRIFDPFFTTKPVGEGTGLGLSISYEIVRKHGGEIRAQSLPAGGALFTLRLPIVRALASGPATAG